MAATGVMNIRIEQELKAKALILARQEGQSLSAWVKRLIEQQVSNTETATLKSDPSKTG